VRGMASTLSTEEYTQNRRRMLDQKSAVFQWIRLLVAERGDVKRTCGRLAARVESMNLQLFRVARQSNGDETGVDGLARRASDRARKIGFCFTLERNFPRDDVLIGSAPLAGFDHVSARSYHRL
jgi:alkylation response protein AidB-like acyl-CoA dehydrogenase